MDTSIQEAKAFVLDMYTPKVGCHYTSTNGVTIEITSVRESLNRIEFWAHTVKGEAFERSHVDPWWIMSEWTEAVIMGCWDIEQPR